MEQELKGKVALVTGSSKGLGKAIVVEFSKLGCNIIINYNVNGESAEETSKECAKYGIKAITIKADVSKYDEVEEMISKVENEFGKIDILVNNAGIIRDRTLKKMSLEEWNDVINTNLNGTFYTTKLALPLIKDNGRIINISSIVGLTGNFGQTNYAATKSALFGFTKSLSKEVGRMGITANVIAPGFLESDMTNKIPFLRKRIIIGLTSLERIGTFEEIAQVVAFIASDRSSYITGEIINVNGGLGL